MNAPIVPTLLERLKIHRTVLLVAMALAILASVYIDVSNSSVMPIDERNRIVGSRIMKDGASPYFYIWKKGDTIRYYDTYVAPNSLMSPATSTPFFHHLTGLIADLPQYKFNTIWLLLQYFVLGSCLLLSILAGDLMRHRNKIYLLAGISIFFTYTFGWRYHLFSGQNYIFIPLFSVLCYYALVQKQNWLHLLLFAIAACSLVLLRPIAILLFLPFLLYLKKYYKWFYSAAVVMFAYVIYVISNPVQKLNWTDYFKSVEIGVAHHQQLLPPVKPVAYNPVPIRSFEGIDFDTEENEDRRVAIKKGAENSNFFIFYNELTGGKISVLAMTTIGLIICVLMLLPLLLIQKKKLSFTTIQLFILGFLIYNMYEFFTPVTRLAYHWVQFLFPLLLSAIFMQRLYLIPTMLLVVGLYLNIAVLPSVKMEHSIGEFLIVIVMFYLVYRALVMKYIHESKLRINKGIYIA
jgi:hypothetical protein